MNDSRDLKAIAEACQQHQPLRFMRSHGALYIRNDNGIVFDVHQNRSFPEFMAQNKDYADLVLAANPAAVLALIAENEEYKAVAEQPASLNAVPATEYAVLKRQFFALRNYALCKDKLSGYYSRELEKLRGVDRSQSAGEIDAERDINEQLTNDLLTVETERDHLKAEVAGLKTGYEAYEQVNAELKAEVEELRKYGEEFAVLAERRREEADALRKDSESYRLLSFCHGQGTLELVRSHHELCAEIRRLKILAGEPVPQTPEEFVGPSPEGPTARIRRKLAALGKGEQS